MSKVIDKEFSAALEYLTDSRIREIVSSKSVARVPEWTPEAMFVPEILSKIKRARAAPALSRAA
jgi:hypothetical protein